MKNLSKRGFTLTELIIVIAILAILAAVLVPLMVGYLNDARQATANANARTVYSAAAAAAVMTLANDQTGSDAPASFADKSYAELSAANAGYFQNHLASLLGSAFKGVLSVTVNEAAQEVTETKWRASAGSEPVGVYPTNEASAAYTNEQIGAEFKTALDAAGLSGNAVYSTVDNDNRTKLLAALPAGVKASLAGKSWSYNSKKLYIYDGDVSSLSISSKLNVEIYDCNNGTLTSGTAYVGSSSGQHLVGTPY